MDICYALGREETRVNQSVISSEHTFISEFQIFLDEKIEIWQVTRFLHEVLAKSTFVLFPPIEISASSENVKDKYRFLSQELPFLCLSVQKAQIWQG